MRFILAPKREMYLIGVVLINKLCQQCIALISLLLLYIINLEYTVQYIYMCYCKQFQYLWLDTKLLYNQTTAPLSGRTADQSTVRLQRNFSERLKVSNFSPRTQTKWVKQFIEFISAVQNCFSSLADFTMCKERKRLKGGEERKKNY